MPGSIVGQQVGHSRRRRFELDDPPMDSLHAPRAGSGVGKGKLDSPCIAGKSVRPLTITHSDEMPVIVPLSVCGNLGAFDRDTPLRKGTVEIRDWRASERSTSPPQPPA